VFWSTSECAIGILALSLSTLAPLIPNMGPRQRHGRYASQRSPYYRRDFESESRLRGIPLDSGMGNTSHIEGGKRSSRWSSRDDDRRRHHHRSRLSFLPALRLKQKRNEQSTENLVRYGRDSKFSMGKGPMISMDDLGILKTTDVITYSDEDLSSKVRVA
jgi:hypothetical protein